MIQLRELGQHRKLNTPFRSRHFFWSALTTTIIAGLFGLMDGLFMISDNPIFGIAVIVLTIFRCLRRHSGYTFSNGILPGFIPHQLPPFCDTQTARRGGTTETHNDQQQVRLS